MKIDDGDEFGFGKYVMIDKKDWAVWDAKFQAQEDKILRLEAQVAAADDLRIVAELTIATGTVKTLAEAIRLYDNASKGDK